MRNLPKAVDFAKRNFIAGRKILVCCQNGEGISICVALAILALLFDDNGKHNNVASLAKLLHKDLMLFLICISA